MSRDVHPIEAAVFAVTYLETYRESGSPSSSTVLALRSFAVAAAQSYDASVGGSSATTTRQDCSGSSGSSAHYYNVADTIAAVALAREDFAARVRSFTSNHVDVVQFPEQIIAGSIIEGYRRNIELTITDFDGTTHKETHRFIRTWCLFTP